MKQDAPTEDSKVIESLSGYCSYGGTDLTKHKCLDYRQRWYHGKSKAGRKTVESIIYLDEWYKCPCLCHISEDERPKPKRKYTRKKKT